MCPHVRMKPDPYPDQKSIQNGTKIWNHTKRLSELKKNPIKINTYMHNGILLSYNEERNDDFCKKMDGTGEHSVK